MKDSNESVNVTFGYRQESYTWCSVGLLEKRLVFLHLISF